jgi:hypothetical protein
VFILFKGQVGKGELNNGIWILTLTDGTIHVASIEQVEIITASVLTQVQQQTHFKGV